MRFLYTTRVESLGVGFDSAFDNPPNEAHLQLATTFNKTENSAFDLWLEGEQGTAGLPMQSQDNFVFTPGVYYDTLLAVDAKGNVLSLDLGGRQSDQPDQTGCAPRDQLCTVRMDLQI